MGYCTLLAFEATVSDLSGDLVHLTVLCLSCHCKVLAFDYHY